MITINLTWPKLFAAIFTLLVSFVSVIAWLRSDLKEDIREVKNDLKEDIQKNRQLIIKYIADKDKDYTISLQDTAQRHIQLLAKT